MPFAKRGFLFNYFDKAVCVLVGLVLLAGVYYTVRRAGGLPQRLSLQSIQQKVDRIRGRLGSAEVPGAPTAVSIPGEGEDVEPEPVRSHVFIWPLPVEYPKIKIGTAKDYVLEFEAPIGEGTVTVQGNEALLDVVAHPVEGDYSKVQIRTRAWEGEAAVVGKSGEVAHIYRVEVDSQLDKIAYPPLSVEATPQGAGSIRVAFESDPRIDTEQVEVASYEIWRRDWSDPTTGYAFVGDVGLGQTGTRPTTRQPRTEPAPGDLTPEGMPEGIPEDALRIMREMGMGGPGMPGTRGTTTRRQRTTRPTTTRQPETQAGRLWWEDIQAQPGNRYSYKARTVATNAFPSRGEFTAPTEPVLAVGSVDFRFTLAARGRVRFEVVNYSPQTRQVNKKTYWVEVGEEIGGVETDARTGESINYLTGATLVGYQQGVPRPGTRMLSDRIIYSDAEGNLRVLWRGETRAEPLWERAVSAAEDNASLLIASYR